jgi:hypothetical protein
MFPLFGPASATLGIDGRGRTVDVLLTSRAPIVNECGFGNIFYPYLPVSGSRGPGICATLIASQTDEHHH